MLQKQFCDCSKLVLSLTKAVSVSDEVPCCEGLQLYCLGFEEIVHWVLGLDLLNGFDHLASKMLVIRPIMCQQHTPCSMQTFKTNFKQLAVFVRALRVVKSSDLLDNCELVLTQLLQRLLICNLLQLL